MHDGRIRMGRGAKGAAVSGASAEQIGRLTEQSGTRRLAQMRGLEATVGCLMAAGVAWLTGQASWGMALALALWVWFTYHLGAGPNLPTLSPDRFDLPRRATTALGVTALLAAVGLVDTGAIPGAAVAVVTATLAAATFRGVRRRFQSPARILLVGDRVAVTELAAKWTDEAPVTVVGVCVVEPDLDDEDYPAEVFDASVIRSIKEVPDAVRRMRVDGVVVASSPGMTSADVRELDWSLGRLRIPLSVIGPLGPFAPHRVHSGVLGGRLLMHVVPKHRSRMLVWLKAGIDRVGGVVLLALTAPLLVALCVAIRLESPGSPLFRQTRVGINGREFTMYKLRTMRIDAEEHLTPLKVQVGDRMLFKMQRDPRVSRIGRWLRQFSLDEVPQLINVARGEMSLIGPRPCLPSEFARYDDESRHRLVVRPGMTGLWQVSGRSDLDWDQSLALDLHYVDNWRFSDDLVIAARTVGAVLLRRGAY